jgi:hypothetical protein
VERHDSALDVLVTSCFADVIKQRHQAVPTHHIAFISASKLFRITIAATST